MFKQRKLIISAVVIAVIAIAGGAGLIARHNNLEDTKLQASTQRSKEGQVIKDWEAMVRAWDAEAQRDKQVAVAQQAATTTRSARALPSTGPVSVIVPALLIAVVAGIGHNLIMRRQYS